MHGLEGSRKLPFKICDVNVFVFPLVCLLGFKKHCGKICMQLLDVIRGKTNIFPFSDFLFSDFFV